MKQKWIYRTAGLLLSAMLGFTSLTACGSAGEEKTEEIASSEYTEAAEEEETRTVVIEDTPQEMPRGLSEELAAQAYVLPDLVRVGCTLGEKSAALAYLMDEQDHGNTRQVYSFTVEEDENVLIDRLKTGELDIAFLSPMKAVITSYETGDQVKAIALHVLSDLYVVSGNSEISLLQDLDGRTVYMTGRGTAAACSVLDILGVYGVSANLEYVEEEADAVNAILADTNTVAILSAEAAMGLAEANDAYSPVIALAESWNSTPFSRGSQMAGGVITASQSLIEAYPDAVDVFLNEYAAAVDRLADKPATDSADLLLKYNLAADCGHLSQDIAVLFPVCIKNTEMVTALNGYYEVVYQADPSLFGDRLPGDEFYYVNTDTEAPTAP